MTVQGSPEVIKRSANSRCYINGAEQSAPHKGNLCNGSTPHFDCGSIGSSPVFPANGLEVENVLLRALWVKRNVGLAHHRNHEAPLLLCYISHRP